METVNPIQDGLFSELLTDKGGRGGKTPLPEVCYTYATMMKLATVIPYLKRMQKVFESRNKSLEFC